MIDEVIPLPIGNAIRLQLDPSPGAKLWTVLRKTVNTFTGLSDPNAVTVASQSSDLAIVDTVNVVNGTTYYYLDYYWDGVEWTSGAVVAAGVATAAYYDDSVDALTLVRDRLAAGIANEVMLGNLVPGQNANGVIPVLTAPPILDQTPWPVVVVHLENEAPDAHGIGELDATDIQTDNLQWNQSEGWFARTTLSIVGWTLNPDTRIALRKAIRRLIIGNLAVFNAAGLRTIDLSQEDVEDLTLQQYNAPLYFTRGTFSCQSPLVVGGQVAPVSDVTVTITVDEAPLNYGSLQ